MSTAAGPVSFTFGDRHRQPERASGASSVLSLFPGIEVIKADLGYRGAFREMPLEELGVRLDCVKSNYGNSGFQPIDGRWVVERTISWSQTYRRLMRNYERYLSTARSMAMFALVFFMLRYFA